MFIEEIDKALKLKLSDITILNPETNIQEKIPVIFVSPEKEVFKGSYPCIAIQIIDISSAVERETHDWRGVLKKVDDKLYKRDMPRAYDITYQIDIFSKYLTHDRYLLKEVLNRLPSQTWINVIDGDDVKGLSQTLWCFLEGVKILDNIKETRIYHKALTYRVLTGIDEDIMREIAMVKEIQNNILTN